MGPKKKKFVKSETPVPHAKIYSFCFSSPPPRSHTIQIPYLRYMNLVRLSDSAAAVTFLSNGELDTLALGQGDPGLLLANDENVALTGSEAVVNGVLDVDNVEATIVTLTVGDDTNTTHVTTTSDHGNGASVELDEVGDLASGEINLDSVVDSDRGVRVTDAKFTQKNLLVSQTGSSRGQYITAIGKTRESQSSFLSPSLFLAHKNLLLSPSYTTNHIM